MIYLLLMSHSGRMKSLSASGVSMFMRLGVPGRGRATTLHGGEVSQGGSGRQASSSSSMKLRTFGDR
jgi:hypothetical protein